MLTYWAVLKNIKVISFVYITVVFILRTYYYPDAGTRQKYSCIIGEVYVTKSSSPGNLIGLHPLLCLNWLIRVLCQRVTPTFECLKPFWLLLEFLKNKLRMQRERKNEQRRRRGAYVFHEITIPCISYMILLAVTK